MNDEIDRASSIALSGPSGVVGSVRVPGDKSISHRALILASLSRGDTLIEGLSAGDDVTGTVESLAQFGVGVDRRDGEILVYGGLRHEPSAALDHGNSGTGMRLMAGVCAGQDMFSVLTGDQYLRERPMDRVVAPLVEMGAIIDGREGGSKAPLAIRGGRLRGITYEPAVASAQVKSAVLLAGLSASGSTTVREVSPTRRHTEEMLTEFGADLDVTDTHVTVRRSELTTPGRVSVPGDPSQAAFWIVAALVADDSDVTAEDLYLGFARLGFADVLTTMGADLGIDPEAGTIRARSSRLQPFTLGQKDMPGVIDEIPILAVAAALANGTSAVTGAQELRVKESDRISSTVAMLRAFGVDAHEQADGFTVHGGKPLTGGEVDARGDHRIAMAAAVCALVAEGESIIHGWGSVATSYPGFASQVVTLTQGNTTPSSTS